MHFSVFLTARSMDPDQDGAIIQAMTDFALQAEELGFDAVFCPDHHFTGYGPMGCDPFLYHGYLAGQLKRMRFGFSVVTGSLHHPVRFVERMNLLDQLTKGRLLVGIGSGTTPEETIGFGVNFQDSRPVLDENLDIAMRLWTKDMQDEPVQFDTGHYRGAVVQRIVPRSFRRPYPLMMGVALREASIKRAVKYGWSAFIPDFVPPFPEDNSPSPKFVESLNAYGDALNRSDHSRALKKELLDWTTHTYQCVHVAETDAQARRELEFIVDQYQQAIDRERPYNKRAEQISGLDLPAAPDARSENWIKAWCLYGSAATVTAELRHYADTGVGNVLLSFTNGPWSEERWRLSQQSIRLFADEVMPHFKPKAAVGAAAL
ncbi:MAG: LLM class flavin-dependent oxidoreductase [Chloroflexi bacterium]|nr:LLM class flavin-dependent oxidoreductase [Chloroflexota bacterium]